MQAIIAGKSSFDYLDEDRHSAARKAHGKARKQLAEYLATNPDASPEQITEKLQSIGIETEADDLRDQYFPSPGVLPPIDGELPLSHEVSFAPPE